MRRTIIAVLAAVMLVGGVSSAEARPRPAKQLVGKAKPVGKAGPVGKAAEVVAADDIYQWVFWAHNNLAYPSCAYVAAVAGAPCVTFGVDAYTWVPGWEHVIANTRVMWRNNYGGNYLTCRQWYRVIKAANGFSSLGSYGGQACSWVG